MYARATCAYTGMHAASVQSVAHTMEVYFMYWARYDENILSSNSLANRALFKDSNFGTFISGHVHRRATPRIHRHAHSQYVFLCTLDWSTQCTFRRTQLSCVVRIRLFVPFKTKRFLRWKFLALESQLTCMQSILRIHRHTDSPCTFRCTHNQARCVHFAERNYLLLSEIVKLLL